jgi:hypothetical protein
VGQIRELIHQVDLGEESMAHVHELRVKGQPSGKLPASAGGDFINDASGAALGGGATGAQQPAFLEAFQTGIDLTEFGGPEMSDAVVQHGFEIVATARLAEETQEDMLETHAGNYIMFYINVNCF